MSSSEEKVVKIIGNKKNILINNFNKIRDIIRIIYLYSSYNNQEIFNVSSRKLREEKLRIKNIFDENCKDSYENSKKYFGLCYNSVIHSKNFLSKIYFIKTFTDLDFILYFFILEALNNGELSIEELLAKYEEMSVEGDGTIFREATSSTMERHLKAMVDNGFIERIKSGKRYLYRNTEDFFEGFDRKEKEDMLNLVRFFSEITPYKAYGHYLQEVIKSDVEIMELDYYDNEKSYLDWYYFSGNHIHNILDEIMLYDIEENKFVEIENDDIKEKVCYLYKILDPVYGRMYVLTKGIDENNIVTDEYIIFRVDRIKSVKKLKKKPKLKKGDKDVSRIKMWNCAIPRDRVVSLETDTVEALFFIDENEDRQVYERLMTEKKWASVVKEDEGRYRFKIDVLDKKELIPWFRTFEGYVVVLDEEINRKFEAERGELLKRYGVL